MCGLLLPCCLRRRDGFTAKLPSHTAIGGSNRAQHHKGTMGHVDRPFRGRLSHTGIRDVRLPICAHAHPSVGIGARDAATLGEVWLSWRCAHGLKQPYRSLKTVPGLRTSQHARQSEIILVETPPEAPRKLTIWPLPRHCSELSRAWTAPNARYCGRLS